MLFDSAKPIQEKPSVPFSLKGFLLGLLWAISLTLLSFVLFALLLTYTSLPEGAIPWIALLTQVASVAVAAAISAAQVGHHGYLSGGLMGLCYTLLLYLISLLFAGTFRVGSHFFILLIIGLFGGAVGGIIGINLKGRGHSHRL